MKQINIWVPEPYVEALDELVRRGLYPHRAEAIRQAIRDLLRAELWKNEVYPKSQEILALERLAEHGRRPLSLQLELRRRINSYDE